MTQEQKRIKIAEICGWVIGTATVNMRTGDQIAKRWEHPTEFFVAAGGLYGFGYNSEVSNNKLPDYFDNLNACHIMETYLSAEPNEDPEIEWFTEQEQYVMQLEILTKSELGLFPEVHASAAIRAEAFFRVKSSRSKDKI